MQSRRNFIGKVATGLAGTLAASNVLGANTRVRIGIIGPGARGSEILREAVACENVECVGAADIYTRRLEDVKQIAPNAKFFDMPLMPARVGDVPAFEAHRAAFGIEHAGDGAQHSGLTGAVGAEYGDDLALRDLQADAADCLDRAVEGLDRGDVEEGLMRTHPSPPIYARTTSGWFCTSSGVPSAITLP